MGDERPQPSELMGRLGLGLSGLGLALISLGFIAWAALDAVVAGLSVVGGVVGVVFATTLLVGLWLGWMALRRRPDRAGGDRKRFDARHKSRQRGILRVAEKMGGRITRADIALHTPMTVDEAEAMLEEMALDGICELAITDDGQQVYLFAAFVDGGADKKTARSVMDEDSYVFDQELERAQRAAAGEREATTDDNEEARAEDEVQPVAEEEKAR